jgi:hypothetical protein
VSAREGIGEVSFVKLDTQGPERDIRRGSTGALTERLGPEVEGQFATLYTGTLLFADVDRFLERRGSPCGDWGACRIARQRTPRTVTRKEIECYNGLRYGSPLTTEGRSVSLSGRVPSTSDPIEREITQKERKLLILAALLDPAGDVDAAVAYSRRVLTADGAMLDGRP